MEREEVYCQSCSCQTTDALVGVRVYASPCWGSVRHFSPTVFGFSFLFLIKALSNGTLISNAHVKQYIFVLIDRSEG